MKNVAITGKVKSRDVGHFENRVHASTFWERRWSAVTAFCSASDIFVTLATTPQIRK